jgi:Fe-S oxidoreductase
MGKCRKKGGTMCPSYMATGEEKHSTRGRARLLGEMLRGEVVTEGWQSEAVKEALDLCLSCKGCKSDCPTQPTWRATRPSSCRTTTRADVARARLSPCSCGRPYYDFGMLDRARATLERVLEVLAPQLERGLPLVVLEPGCLSVFRDELHQLFPRDARAQRLTAQATSLGEFLDRKAFRAEVPPRIFVHGHCHQKALWGNGAEIALLQACGAEVIAPDTGCCGMAGSFGYRPEFYETSRRIAGLALLPALEAAPQAAVLASGFSCREQIEALAGRPTLHLADMLA